MSQSATYQKSLSTGGRTFSKSSTQDGDGGLVVEPDGGVAAAKMGSLTGKTDADTGIATLSTGHGIATSDVVDVYWSGGARFGMTATVSGNAVTVDGGSGTSLPNTGTALAVKKPQDEVFRVDGRSLAGLYIKSAGIGAISFYNSAGSLTYATTFTASGSEAYVYGDGVTNPLASASAVNRVSFSHGSSAALSQLVAAVYG